MPRVFLLFFALLFAAPSSFALGFGPAAASWPSAPTGGGGGGTGDVAGPASATATQAATFADGTGKLLAASVCTISSTGAVDCPADVNTGGMITLKEASGLGNNRTWVLKLPDAGIGASHIFQITSDGKLPIEMIPAIGFADLGSGTLTGAGTLIVSTGTTITTGGSGTISATTAASLAANGTNCTSGEFAAGVDAAGNAEGCALPIAQDYTPTTAGDWTAWTAATINSLQSALDNLALGVRAAMVGSFGNYNRVVDLTNGYTWTGAVPSSHYTNPVLQLQEAFNPGLDSQNTTVNWRVRSFGKATIAVNTDCYDKGGALPVKFCLGLFTVPKTPGTGGNGGFSGGSGVTTGWPIPGSWAVDSNMNERTATTGSTSTTLVDSLGSLPAPTGYHSYIKIVSGGTGADCTGQKRQITSVTGGNTYHVDKAWTNCNPDGATYTVMRFDAKTGTTINFLWDRDGTELLFDLTNVAKPAVGIMAGDCWFKGFEGDRSSSCIGLNHFDQKGRLLIQLISKSTLSTGWTAGQGKPVSFDKDNYFDGNRAFAAIVRDQMTRSTWDGKTVIDGGYSIKAADSVGFMSRLTWGSNVLGALHILYWGTGMEFFSNNVATYEYPYVADNLIGVTFGTAPSGGESVVSATCATGYCGPERGGGGQGANGITINGGVIEGNTWGEVVAFDVMSTRLNDVHIENGSTLSGHSILIGAGQCSGGAYAGSPCAEDSDCGAGTCPLSNPNGGYIYGNLSANTVNMTMSFIDPTLSGATDQRWAEIMLGKNARGPNQRVEFANSIQLGYSSPVRVSNICKGGSNDGNACTVDGDCPSGVCSNNTLCAGAGDPVWFCTANGKANVEYLTFRMPLNSTERDLVTTNLVLNNVQYFSYDGVMTGWPDDGSVWSNQKQTTFLTAGCNGTTAAPLVDTPATGAVTASCHGTDPVKYGTIDYPDGSTTTSCVHFQPSQWNAYGHIDVWLKWGQWTVASPSGSVLWQVRTACFSPSQALNDPGASFNAAVQKTDTAPAQYRAKWLWFENVTATSCKSDIEKELWVCVDRVGGDSSDTYDSHEASLLEMRINTMTH